MNHLRPLDNPADIDYKEEVAQLENKAYVESDPRLAGLADELAWAHGLSEEELAAESKKLLRKVSCTAVPMKVKADVQVDWRLMPTLFIVSLPLKPASTFRIRLCTLHLLQRNRPSRPLSSLVRYVR